MISSFRFNTNCQTIYLVCLKFIRAIGWRVSFYQYILRFDWNIIGFYVFYKGDAYRAEILYIAEAKFDVAVSFIIIIIIIMIIIWFI